jgi:site-specific DNA-methyltransferase (adenine-specific)
MNMVRLVCGDALEQLRLLPDESVQCCITSPPYWGLRDYGIAGQLGLERTPEEYVAKLVKVFREVRRVLRDDGTFWLNLGDCYHSGDCGGYRKDSHRWENSHMQAMAHGTHMEAVSPNRLPQAGLKDKDLVGIPWRVAFALQADGWWLRSDIIWNKPNPMPESVTDRPTKAHEYLFLLTKSGETTCWYHTRRRAWAFSEPVPDYIWRDHAHGGQERDAEPPGDWRDETYLVNGKQSRRWSRLNLWRGHDYYYDAEAIRERATPQHIRALSFERETKEAEVPGQGYRQHRLGRAKVPSGWDQQSTSHRHRRGRYKNASQDPHASGRRIVENVKAARLAGGDHDSPFGLSRNRRTVWTIPTQPYPEAHFATFPEALVEPCIAAGSRLADTLLDPFCGSGTVGVVALRAGRDVILIDLNPEYVEMARRRIEGTAPLFVSVDNSVQDQAR